MAERLLISSWLTSENRDGHSLWLIRRDGTKHVLVSFVKAPAIDDQPIPELRIPIVRDRSVQFDVITSSDSY